MIKEVCNKMMDDEGNPINMDEFMEVLLSNYIDINIVTNIVNTIPMTDEEILIQDIIKYIDSLTIEYVRECLIFGYQCCPINNHFWETFKDDIYNENDNDIKNSNNNNNDNSNDNINDIKDDIKNETKKIKKHKWNIININDKFINQVNNEFIKALNNSNELSQYVHDNNINTNGFIYYLCRGYDGNYNNSNGGSIANWKINEWFYKEMCKIISKFTKKHHVLSTNLKRLYNGNYTLNINIGFEMIRDRTFIDTLNYNDLKSTISKYYNEYNILRNEIQHLSKNLDNISLSELEGDPKFFNINELPQIITQNDRDLFNDLKDEALKVKNDIRILQKNRHKLIHVTALKTNKFVPSHTLNNNNNNNNNSPIKQEIPTKQSNNNIENQLISKSPKDTIPSDNTIVSGNVILNNNDININESDFYQESPQQQQQQHNTGYFDNNYNSPPYYYIQNNDHRMNIQNMNYNEYKTFLINDFAQSINGASFDYVISKLNGLVSELECKYFQHHLSREQTSDIESVNSITKHRKQRIIHRKSRYYDTYYDVNICKEAIDELPPSRSSHPFLRSYHNNISTYKAHLVERQEYRRLKKLKYESLPYRVRNHYANVLISDSEYDDTNDGGYNYRFKMNTDNNNINSNINNNNNNNNYQMRRIPQQLNMNNVIPYNNDDNKSINDNDGDIEDTDSIVPLVDGQYCSNKDDHDINTNINHQNIQQPINTNNNNNDIFSLYAYGLDEQPHKQLNNNNNSNPLPMNANTELKKHFDVILNDHRRQKTSSQQNIYNQKRIPLKRSNTQPIKQFTKNNK